MNDELAKYYELLGVAPGASGSELKQAYHDLAKVWHPDRFSHDPRLQQKAEKKLKEINDAYERLKSGKAPRPTSPPSNYQEPPVVAARRRHPRLILVAAVILCAAFIGIMYLSLLTLREARPAHTQTPTAEREEAPPTKESGQSKGESNTAAGQSRRSSERTSRLTQAEANPASASSGASDVISSARDAESNARTLRPMPTVTVTVDAVNGLLATEDCPTVTRMTYPAGDEPKRYCHTQHRTKINLPTEPTRPKDSH